MGVTKAASSISEVLKNNKCVPDLGWCAGWRGGRKAGSGSRARMARSSGEVVLEQARARSAAPLRERAGALAL